MIRSMTAFARQDLQQSWGMLSCEIRTVNHRYLEPQFRLPDVLRDLENDLREALRTRLRRGKVDVEKVCFSIVPLPWTLVTRRGERCRGRLPRP